MSRPCPCCGVQITASCPECGWPACRCAKELAEYEADQGQRHWAWDTLMDRLSRRVTVPRDAELAFVCKCGDPMTPGSHSRDICTGDA